MIVKVSNPEKIFVIGAKVYKDDTVVGKVIDMDPDTGEATIEIDSMFDNFFRDSSHIIGLSSRKIPKEL